MQMPLHLHGVTPVTRTRLETLARLGACALCIVHLAFAAACAKAKAAELVPDGPPLTMTAPPPRVITPVEEVAVAPPPAPPPTPDREPVTAATTKPSSPRQQRPADSKPDPPPAVATQPPPAAAPAEPLEVRSVPSAAAAAEDKKVREVIDRAQRDLKRVNEGKLSAEGKVQLAQAKRDVDQAEEVLKTKSFVYAMALAERAATLAAELAGRTN
jgi:hypothetical protein